MPASVKEKNVARPQGIDHVIFRDLPFAFHDEHDVVLLHDAVHMQLGNGIDISSAQRDPARGADIEDIVIHDALSLLEVPYISGKSIFFPEYT